MAGREDTLAGTIDDFLLSIAEGITGAQRKLDELGAAGQGSMPYSYHLPKVDFELKVTMEMHAPPSVGGSTTPRPLLPRAARRMLKLKPISVAQSSAAGFVGEAVSVIAGSFIAVPRPDDAAVRFHSTMIQRDATIEFTVHATRSSGEGAAGIEVHFNLDRAESRRVSAAVGITADPQPNTDFEQGVVVTGGDGKATSTLRIASGETAGLVLVVVLDAAGQSEQVQVPIRTS